MQQKTQLSLRLSSAIHLMSIVTIFGYIFVSAHLPAQVPFPNSIPFHEETIQDYLHPQLGSQNSAGFVKFSVPVDENGVLGSYFAHPKNFEFHADFLTTTDQFFGLTPLEIDNLALNAENRKVLLGNFILRKPSPSDSNFPSLPWDIDIQLISYDPLTPDLVKEVIDQFERVSGDSIGLIRYLPVTEQETYVRDNLDAFRSFGIEIVPKDSHRDVVCYSPGWTVGTVKIIEASDLPQAIAQNSIGKNDILVMDKAPREVPLVGGIITSTASSPLSHAALLSQMNQTPFFYQKDAISDPYWQQLAASGDRMFLKAKGGSDDPCDVRVRDSRHVNSQEIEELSQFRRPPTLDFDDANRRIEGVIDLDGRSYKHRLVIGAKAASLAELRRIISENTVDQGMAIGIGAYHKFLDTAKSEDGRTLRAVLTPLLERVYAEGDDPQSVELLLADIRKLIKKASIDPGQSQEILTSLKAKWPAGTRLKLRSSSNIEDHPLFNGAGLYDSKGVCLGDDDQPTEATSLCEGRTKLDPVLKDLKKVWASLYTHRAHIARAHYGIKDAALGMGVLVHPSFQGELARGVILSSYTQNGGSSPEDSIQALISGFPGENLTVVNPEPGKIPELMRVTSNRTTLVTATSELPVGRHILNEDEYVTLRKLVAKAHMRFSRIFGKNPKTASFDLEWKLMPYGNGRKLIIKQIRPVPEPSLSRNFIGRGSQLIGLRQGSFCPIPGESSDALAKVQSFYRIKASVGYHSVPLSANSISNPFETLQIDLGNGNWKSIDLPESVAVNSRDWREYHFSVASQRRVELSFPVSHPDLPKGLRLSWIINQKRPIQLSESDQLENNFALLDPVKVFSEAEMTLRIDNQFPTSYVAIKEGQACDAEAHQLFQAGQIDQIAGQARETKEVSVTLEAIDFDRPISLEIHGRTGNSSEFQDKTAYVLLESAVISGILHRPIYVSDSTRMVYAGGHHNFSDAIAIDLWAADLTALERQELMDKQIRYLVMPYGPDQFGGSIRTEFQASTVSHDGSITPLGIWKATRGGLTGFGRGGVIPRR
ncbi:MAG: hypothetical protein HRU19_28795 [Pseudobacteriovorax sp.]|nr:hypothetical protein [Pseudobacteriovorax sp.]